jgi:hypothetical protein
MTQIGMRATWLNPSRVTIRSPDVCGILLRLPAVMSYDFPVWVLCTEIRCRESFRTSTDVMTQHPESAAQVTMRIIAGFMVVRATGWRCFSPNGQLTDAAKPRSVERLVRPRSVHPALRPGGGLGAPTTQALHLVPRPRCDPCPISSVAHKGSRRAAARVPWPQTYCFEVLPLGLGAPEASPVIVRRGRTTNRSSSS